MSQLQTCRLCKALAANAFFRDKRGEYFQCGQCSFVFVADAAFLSLEQEKDVYELHQNSPADPGYRAFLNRLATPLDERLGRAGQHGLDFGAGPGPALAIMLEEAGYDMTLYDPFYYPDKSVLDKRYDFVTCTEAIEHFYHPDKEWATLLGLLKAGGWLAIMTKLLIDTSRFSRWTYKNDPTHVGFFSEETFTFLARRDGLDCEFVGNDVIFFKKSG